MCETPPLENMKIIRFAFGMKWDCLGASGSVVAVEDSPINWERIPGNRRELPTMERSNERRFNLKGAVEPGEDLKRSGWEKNDEERGISFMDLVSYLEWLYRQDLVKIHHGQLPFLGLWMW